MGRGGPTKSIVVTTEQLERALEEAGRHHSTVVRLEAPADEKKVGNLDLSVYSNEWVRISEVWPGGGKGI